MGVLHYPSFPPTHYITGRNDVSHMCYHNDTVTMQQQLEVSFKSTDLARLILTLCPPLRVKLLSPTMVLSP
jgi:hypothetical protein